MLTKKLTLTLETTVNQEYNTWPQKEKENYIHDLILSELDDVKLIKLEDAPV